jgi:hypothetical protein
MNVTVLAGTLLHHPCDHHLQVLDKEVVWFSGSNELYSHDCAGWTAEI